MARSIADIKAQMVAEKNTQTSLSGLTSTSQTAIWNLIFYICAVSINLFEQVLDLFKTDIETQIASAAAGSDSWVRAKMFEFQYSATTPQVVQLNNYAPSYVTVDTNLRIISRCSVKTGANKTVTVKVATGEPPAALSTPQLNAAKGYLNNSGSPSTNGSGIGFAGVQYNVVSLSPDLLLLSGNLTYNGQYASTIKQSVINAVNDYMKNIEFDGVFRLTSLVDYIQTVPGVIDFTIEDCGIRTAASSFPTGLVYLSYNFQYIYPTYPLTAGYIIGETTVNFNIGDNITFIAQ